MPKYAALVYAAESGAPAPDSPELPQLIQSFSDFVGEAQRAGIMVGGKAFRRPPARPQCE
jgi:hypothetical protein